MMAKRRPGAAIVLADPLFVREASHLVRLAAEQRLPVMYALREIVEAGGLMAYGPNLRESYRRAATYVDKILKGAKPAELPVERPTKFEHNRWIGDRRSHVVYDVDNLENEAIIEELLSAASNEGLNGVAYTCFGPDTLPEARNRGYKPYKGDGFGGRDLDDDA